MREEPPFTTRTHVRTEGEPRGRAYVDRAVEQAEKETLQLCRPLYGKAAVLIVQIASRWRLLVDKALSEAGRRRLLNRWLAQWAVAVQRRNFEVYRDCLAGSELGSKEEQGEVIDLVAGATGMQ